ncbi:hypothetical protein M3204_11165 [Mesobacillus subterraneus]|uniref:hypothetical protein n=1 Tax=Mesobacillus subterraneus TaxID=285983 RepID=UPI00203D6D49|nr:hypothetical protein [Mesobacillus subterraneus]MCM3664968.1 hypothetical protein [Mesobacillus subterraneus]MCM3682055.1 hypothetical protein [Mesobacillus subterraneus]
MALDFSQVTDVNEIHDQAIIQHFKNGINHKALVLSPSYPYIFIGIIKKVLGDTVEIDVETTHFAQLENRKWYIHIHNIEVFYIERPGAPKIPKLDDL